MNNKTSWQEHVFSFILLAFISTALFGIVAIMWFAPVPNLNTGSNMKCTVVDGTDKKLMRCENKAEICFHTVNQCLQKK